jgi:hypothetical protein
MKGESSVNAEIREVERVERFPTQGCLLANHANQRSLEVKRVPVEQIPGEVNCAVVRAHRG